MPNEVLESAVDQTALQPFFDFLPPADIAFIFGADNNVAIGNGTNDRNNTYLEFLASGNVVTG